MPFIALTKTKIWGIAKIKLVTIRFQICSYFICTKSQCQSFFFVIFRIESLKCLFIDLHLMLEMLFLLGIPFDWTQDENEVKVTFSVGKKLTENDIDVDFTDEECSLQLKGIVKTSLKMRTLATGSVQEIMYIFHSKSQKIFVNRSRTSL